MSLDIGYILDGWEYEPGQLTARKIAGVDGREKIQLRVELGILQMETSGRPDGKRPHECESLLHYYHDQLKQYERENGTDVGFDLDEQACELLRAEAMMYYHRYLAEFILEDYRGVERDTLRNLRVMDFCNTYAGEESDRYILEQYRPYVTMMCTRARGRLAVRENRPKVAMAALRKGIEQIEEFYRRFGEEESIENSGEIAILKAMEKEIELRIPVDPIKKLRQKLARAVREERYEEAATLRDQIRHATGQGPIGPARP